MEITVLNRQSLLDVALQHTGSVYSAFSIAIANNLSVSESVDSGTILLLPDVQKNTDILNYYSAKKIKPATAVIDLIFDENVGIGEMIIESTFIVA